MKLPAIPVKLLSTICIIAALFIKCNSAGAQVAPDQELILTYSGPTICNCNGGSGSIGSPMVKGPSSWTVTGGACTTGTRCGYTVNNTPSSWYNCSLSIPNGLCITSCKWYASDGGSGGSPLCPSNNYCMTQQVNYTSAAVYYQSYSCPP